MNSVYITLPQSLCGFGRARIHREIPSTLRQKCPVDPPSPSFILNREMSDPSKKRPAPLLIGWREWVSLPDLHIPQMKAKIDSGARTSSLHASDLEFYHRAGKEWVKFIVHPFQHSKKETAICHAPIVDHRKVKSSSGTLTERPVILTSLVIGSEKWEIELNLVNRDMMGFRMLIGRQAVRKRCLINPGRSFLTQKKKKKAKAKKAKRKSSP